MELNPILVSLLICLAINLIAYLIAFATQTDKLTDLTYSITFIVIALHFYLQGVASTTRTLLFLMPVIWALRLGGYLFLRILRKQKDIRFDGMRPVWWKFGGFWTLQALSIWIISLPFVFALSNSAEGVLSFSPTMGIGLFIFSARWLIEGLADYQKSRFKAKTENKNNFISSGLFSLIRYPNYLGEMLVWTGIFLACLPFLAPAQLISILSPLWIIFLLIRISGINLLQPIQDKKYGHRPDYNTYKNKTSKLIPGLY